MEYEIRKLVHSYQDLLLEIWIYQMSFARMWMPSSTPGWTNTPTIPCGNPLNQKIQK